MQPGEGTSIMTCQGALENKEFSAAILVFTQRNLKGIISYRSNEMDESWWSRV